MKYNPFEFVFGIVLTVCLCPRGGNDGGHHHPPRRQPIIRLPDQQALTGATQLQASHGEIMSIGYVECAHCGETVGTYYVTCPYCGYKLAVRRPTGMDEPGRKRD